MIRLAHGLLAAMLLLVGSAPAHGRDRRDPGEAIRFSVHGMSCEACARKIEAALSRTRGVKHAEIDYASRSGVAFTKGGGVTLEALALAAADLGYEILEPGREPAPSLPPDVLAALDARTVSVGERVESSALLVPGKVTIVDYFAKWCGPCRLLERELQRMVHASGGRAALRRVDLVAWDSAAARQATAEFALPALPFVRVFGPDGELLGSVQGNFPAKVEALVQSGLGAGAAAESAAP